jgi:hypothetical protein
MNDLKFSSKLICINEHTYSPLEEEGVLFLSTILLHYSQHINRDKMLGMFNSIKGGMFHFKKTYHCTINDKWYNDELGTYIMKDVLESFMGISDIPFDEVVKYVNLYLNNPKNYCIDWTYSHLIEPVITHYNKKKWASYIGLSTEYLTYEEADLKYDLSSGYCCEDCDGCLSRYKWSKYEDLEERDFGMKLTELVLEYLDTKRKPIHKYFPKFKN